MERATYTTQLLSISGAIHADHREAFISTFRERENNPAYVFGYSVFFGFTGIDRFLIGDWGKGLAKLFSLGGIGIWWFVDTALIAARAREKNILVAKQVADALYRLNSSDAASVESVFDAEPVIDSSDVETRPSTDSIDRSAGFKSRPKKVFRSRPQMA